MCAKLYITCHGGQLLHKTQIVVGVDVGRRVNEIGAAVEHAQVGGVACSLVCEHQTVQHVFAYVAHFEHARVYKSRDQTQ